LVLINIVWVVSLTQKITRYFDRIDRIFGIK
jgi:hypothetical protein